MQIPTMLEIQEAVNDATGTNLPTLHGLVLQNLTVESLEPYFKHQLCAIDYHLELDYGGYDTIYQDSLNETLLRDDSIDFILLTLWLPSFSKLLYEDFSSATPTDINNEITRINHFIENVIANIRKHNNAPVLLFNFTQPYAPALGIYEQSTPHSQFAAIRTVNDHLANFARQHDMISIVDLNHCIFRIGHHHALDWRFWHIAKMPFSHELRFELATELAKFMRALTGKTKKCLVLDCDNVLWGGVVGEVGWEQVAIGADGPGLPYYLLQKEIINLYHRGILIALCSKNNEDDVLECLQKNPHMLIHEKHIVTTQINWDDKATNMEKIARNLNIGLDSLVFMDDNPFETEIIATLLPEVTTLHAANPATNHQLLANCGLFDTLNYTPEDKSRSRLYKEEQIRRDYQKTIHNLDDYLHSLNMQMQISHLDAVNFARATQLIQRTNQFNMTTQRYTATELKNFISSDKHDVITATLADKFGNYGMCGLAVIAYEQETALLESFLLSCRVLGRNVEHAFLNECIAFATAKKMQTIIGKYQSTKKNHTFCNFYLNQGFKQVGAGLFQLTITANIQTKNAFIEVKTV